MNKNLLKAAKLIAELAELAEQDESINSLVTRSWGIKGDDRGGDGDDDEKKTVATDKELEEIISHLDI